MKLREETGGQKVWAIQSSTAYNITEIGSNVQFWFVNDPVLNSMLIYSHFQLSSSITHCSQIGFVADEISFFGNVGIIGLYMTIVVTLGGVIRNFLLPQVTTLMYVLIE